MRAGRTMSLDDHPSNRSGWRWHGVHATGTA